MNKGRADDLAFMETEGVTRAMLLAGARRVQDQCDIVDLTTAASIAREIFLEMKRSADLSPQ